ncbi:hypothetical protein ANCCAN_21492 [Ancylostoma caninum]|uniref:Uncharacterized protein n=1 Tax=Ancylostoma caninum TaxID=29170 RepID=A0A368FKN0_ANCCA|nr:hypothetical protein ANCCAN_21492 [Ancylostoma caninum]
MSVPRIPAQSSGSLTCPESLQRAPSPVLFPENVPGAGKHNTEHDIQHSTLQGMFTNKQKNFRTDLSPDDVKLVNAFSTSENYITELGRLTPDQLAEYIKNVQNTAYSLGIDEARQFSRGKMLQIFKR